MIRNMAAAQSVHDMPIRGLKSAPRTFKGQSSYIKEFLEEYEALLGYNNVTDDSEKCKTLRRYCSSSVREVLETLPHFTAPNWDQLKEQLQKLYDSDRNDRRFKKQDLKEYCRKMR